MTLPAAFFVSDELAAPVWINSTPKDKASDDTTIQLEVDVVPDATGYRFYASETPGFTPGPGNQIVAQASPVYEHTGLDLGDTWYYRSRAFNLSQEGAISDEGSATVLARVPGIPTIGTVTFDYGVLESTIPWTPQAPLTATLFRIKFDRGPCGGGWVGEAESPPTEASSPAIRDVLEFNSYRYKVQAENPSGVSGYSAWSNTIVTAQAPNAPTSLSATKSGVNPESEIDLTWTDPTTGSLNDVEIHRAATEFGSYSLIDTVEEGVEEYTDSVGDEETWWYKVRGINDCGIGPGAFSNADDATTDAAAPGPGPTDISLVPKQATDHQVTIDWTEVLDATDHDVYVSLSTMGADPTVGGTQVGGDTSVGPIDVDVASLLGAGPDDQIFVNIRGVNAGGDGTWGTEANGYTHVRVPQNFDAEIRIGDCPTINFDITWDNLNTDSDARSETMTLERDDGAGYSVVDSSVSAGSTSYYDTGGSGSTVGYRLKYNSESPYATDTDLISECPE